MSDINIPKNNTNFTSRNTIVYLILGLLILISGVILYNYWIIYTHTSAINDSLSTSANPITNTVIYQSNNMNNPVNNHVNSLALESVQKLESESLQKPEIKSIHMSVQNPESPPVQKQEEFKDSKKVFNKSVNPEKGIVKLIIFHMNGCLHCSDLMEIKNENNKTKFELITDIFDDDNSVQIMDFKAGRDKEADPYRFLPTILIVTENKSVEYTGPRDVQSMSKAIIDAKHNLIS
jgi:hypothetical protein